MSQEIGYARVSKTEQHLALQLDALKKRGVARVFTDKQTGIRFDRKAFLAAMDYLNEGNTLVVWKLDRLGRSVFFAREKWLILKMMLVANCQTEHPSELPTLVFKLDFLNSPPTSK